MSVAKHVFVARSSDLQMPEKENAGNVVRRFRLAGSYANVGLSRIRRQFGLQTVIPRQGWARRAKKVKLKRN
jgi:hypothetical protein